MAQEAISSNKRIAKNTVMLYIRMLLSMVVSLYTSRVVLNTLGVEDYGIYGVVGGVVAMFSFLNSAMSGATSRFLTYEMGRGDTQRLKDTFSSALLVHIGIALIVFVLSETVGLWFLIHKLVIPDERMIAAHVVYQLSILSTMVSITQVPYNATIIAHEKMDIYAYVELLNVSLKLLIVFLLPVIGHDKLIVYGILIFAVSVLIAMTYRWYCFKRFQEVHFRFFWNKNIIYPMLSFTGWDLYGNMSVSWRQQGMNFLLNIFFGPALNAASSIATTIQGVISGLSGNISMAYRPQIIKNYASRNFDRMNELLVMSVKFTLTMFLMIAIPAFIEIETVLSLWLGIVPEYTATFFRLIILSNIFTVVNGIITIPIHATGNIKQISFYTGSIYLISLLPMYVALKMSYGPSAVYVFLIVSAILILIANLMILKSNVKEARIYPIIKEMMHSLIIMGIVSVIIYKVSGFIDQRLLSLLVVCGLSVILYGSLFIAFQMNREQRWMLLSRIFKKR